jgi:hypothetical protein
MPINSYGRKPQTDALTKIAQALQIAQSTLGIPVEWEKMQSFKQDQAVKDASAARQAKLDDPNSLESRAAQEATAGTLGSLQRSGALDSESGSKLSSLVRGLDLQGPVQPGGSPLKTPGLSASYLKDFNETNPQVKIAIEKEKAKAAASALAVRTAGQNDRLDERRNQNAAQAGKEFETDPILTQTKKTINNITRAQQLLDGNTPITAKSFNILQQDFINATAGGSATEGKVNREMIANAQTYLNDLAAKIGSVKDVRKEMPDVVQNLRELFHNVREDFYDAQEAQAKNIADNYSSNTNPKVRDTVALKLKNYSRSAQAAREQAGKGDGLPGIPSANASESSALLKGTSRRATDQAPASGPHGPSVTQNGHVYNWNPQSKQYE